MILAVVDRGAEIDDRKSGEITAFGRSANAFLDRRNPVLGNRSAENIVHELNAGAARRRLHADAADAELPVPAGLFFVLALGVGLAADRLAIGHFGRLERQVDVVALVQLRDDHLDVLLPGARQQKFLRLRIARKMQ